LDTCAAASVGIVTGQLVPKAVSDFYLEELYIIFKIEIVHKSTQRNI